MSGEIPWPPPERYDPSGPFSNPGATLPRPLGKNVPVGCWFGPQTMVPWVAGTGQVIRTAGWRSPIFDLRPELGVLGLANARRDAGAIPIWRPGIGAGGQLFLQIMGLASATDTLTGLAVVGIEYAHASDPNQVSTVTTEEDLTAAYFTAGKASALIPVFPTGGGFPIRFWRYELRFDVYATHPDPALSITPAYY